MDIRLFKFLIFLFFESIFSAALLILRKFHFFPSLNPLITNAILILLIFVPILLILPDDNWIWLLEEDPRARKISMYEKAVKHLHLSTLYFLALGFPTFVFFLAVFIKNHNYQRPLELAFIGTAPLAGIYCAYQNYLNVMKYVSLFAVGWDKRSPFYEIFVGLTVSRSIRYFYPKIVILIGFIFFTGSFIIPYIYFSRFATYIISYDRERMVMLTSLFNAFFTFGIWATTMYVVFQLFFSRRLEWWVREKKKQINSKKQT